MITVQELPLKLKTNVNMNCLYCSCTNAVAVKYCVLRPKTKDNT